MSNSSATAWETLPDGLMLLESKPLRTLSPIDSGKSIPLIQLTLTDCFFSLARAFARRSGSPSKEMPRMMICVKPVTLSRNSGNLRLLMLLTSAVLKCFRAMAAASA